MTYSNFRRAPRPIAAESLANIEHMTPPHPGLPPGIRLTMALGQPIDTAAAGFGDRIQAVLVAGMAEKSGKVLFPAGAVANGRVIKLAHVYGSTESVYSLTIMLRWETVDQRSISQPFTARLLRKGSARAGYHLIEQFSAIQGVLLQEADGLPLRISDYGLFGVAGLKPGYVLPKDTLSIWESVAQ
jgi:hypothetical protein